MIGMYALKPWYGRQLGPVVDHLARRSVRPDVITAWGVAFGIAGGGILAFAPSGLVVGLVVAVCVAARLACANIDGTLARLHVSRPVGRLHNELGDRLADIALLAGFCVHVPWAGWVLFATTLPSWISLAISASGGGRSNAGPTGKTERCLIVVIAALSGWFTPCAIALIVGGVGTAAVRLRLGASELSDVQR
jgi:CDP-diacylglycerol--glycerol-3-phosphate 3-phosphatidyltransferase